MSPKKGKSITMRLLPDEMASEMGTPVRVARKPATLNTTNPARKLVIPVTIGIRIASLQ